MTMFIDTNPIQYTFYLGFFYFSIWYDTRNTYKFDNRFCTNDK